jgi:dihydrodipicolinate synthase/N-acetylneuraminate lyase
MKGLLGSGIGNALGGGFSGSNGKQASAAQAIVGQGGAGGVSAASNYVAWVKATGERSVDDWLKYNITPQDIINFPNAKTAAAIKNSPLMRAFE